MILTDCPKHMTYGPCGGVRPGGGCAVEELECPFADTPVPMWGPAPGPRGGDELNPRAVALRASLARGGVVVVDFPARALDAGSLRECAAAHVDLDAVLVGDAPGSRVQFPPSYRAALLQAAGVTAWVGLNARDRNRVALEAEIAALSDLQVAAVHCVTLVCDAGSAALRASFRGEGTDRRAFERILAVPDPRQVGIDAATELGRRMLDTGLVAGVDLSGGPGKGEELACAQALAEAAQGLRR